MSSNSSRPTPADIMAFLLSPLLIMAMVGSLVFFLLEVLYAGANPGRMQWVLFFFIFGAVLVARIALQPEIAVRAGFYGPVLGLAAWLAVQNYVQYPAHLARYGGLVTLGLIILILWCTHRLTWDCTHLDDRAGATGLGVLDAAGLEEGASIQRYKKKQQGEEQGARTPGVWVIYFSLAALPLFGLGQALIPPEETGRRLYTFWLMVSYVGSGLGLLVTTSFLGLRLYLQRRGMRMPLSMTATWLTIGSLLIVALLAGGALLPRPNSEVNLLDPERATSAHTEGKNGKGFNEEAGVKVADHAGKPEGDGDRTDGSKKGNREDKSEGGQKGAQQFGAANTPPSQSWLATVLPVVKWIVFGLIALFVLFVVLRGLLRSAAGFWSWARNLLHFFQSFWDALARLFGRKPQSTGAESEESEVNPIAQQPFDVFSNPFIDGRAEKMPVALLVRYSFAALEAWARERQLGRRRGETAIELAERIGEEFPPLDSNVRRLAQLYALVVYGRGGLPPGCRDSLRDFWRGLGRVSEQPLSA
jgi:hypothetical protein